MTNFDQSIQMLARRELTRPCLLFVASHRPCAFVIGQLLYLLVPLAAILGQTAWQDWAALLSQPDGVAWLEERLVAATLEHQKIEHQKGHP